MAKVRASEDTVMAAINASDSVGKFASARARMRAGIEAAYAIDDVRPLEPPMERIVAAAIQHEGVTISLPQPARHAQVLHCAEQFLPDHALAAVCQGFVTSEGRFVNRVQARQIAYVAGQNPRETGGPRDLYSEDLW